MNGWNVHHRWATRPRIGRSGRLMHAAGPTIAFSIALVFGLWAGLAAAQSPESRARTALTTAAAAAPDQDDGAPPEAPPALAAVAELYQPDPGDPAGAPLDAASYPLVPAGQAYAWPHGGDGGDLASGIGLLVLPNLERSVDMRENSSEIAILNAVDDPGFTDLILYFFDANGLADFVCVKLNERQVEYIDLATWGYWPAGFRGQMIVSAEFWEHDHFDPEGRFLHSSVGIAAVVVDRPVVAESAGLGAAARAAIPLDVGAGDVSLYRPIALRQCARFPSRRFFASPTPRPPTSTPSPGPSPTPEPTRTPTPGPSPTPIPSPTRVPTLSPTPTATAWPTPRGEWADESASPALRFPAAGAPRPATVAERGDCHTRVTVHNPNPRHAMAVLVAQPSVDGSCASGGPACGEGFFIDSALIDPAGHRVFELPPDFLAGGAVTVFSLDRRALRAVGIQAPGTIDQVLLDMLDAQLREGCFPWLAWLGAWRDGTAYPPEVLPPIDGLRVPVLAGRPLEAEIRRTCRDSRVAQTAIRGADLGWRPIGVGGEDAEASSPGDASAWRYVAPLGDLRTFAGAGGARPGDPGAGGGAITKDIATVRAHLQATSLECSLVRVGIAGYDGAVEDCPVAELPPGAAVDVDLSACVAETGGRGTVIVEADHPVAVVVDTVLEGAGTDGRRHALDTTGRVAESVAAAPSRRHDPLARGPLGAPPSVAFAPLLHHGYTGWHSRLRLHNPDAERAVMVAITVMDRSGGWPLAQAEAGPIRPGATTWLELADLLPPDCQVLHARLEARWASSGAAAASQAGARRHGAAGGGLWVATRGRGRQEATLSSVDGQGVALRGTEARLDGGVRPAAQPNCPAARVVRTPTPRATSDRTPAPTATPRPTTPPVARAPVATLVLPIVLEGR